MSAKSLLTTHFPGNKFHLKSFIEKPPANWKAQSLDEIAGKWAGKGWDKSAASVRQLQSSIQSIHKIMSTFKDVDEKQLDFKKVRETALVPSIVDDMEKAYRDTLAEEPDEDSEMKKQLEHTKEFFTQKFQTIFDNEGKDLLDSIDDSLEQMKNDMAKLDKFEYQLDNNPNFTVNQAMEIFPGILEQVEKEFLESENPWLVDEDPFEFDAKLREEKKHEHHDH